MTGLAGQTHPTQRGDARTTARFGGMLWRLARFSTPLMLPFAGKRWNPIFAIVEHRGRKTGRQYAAPIAARRVSGGFVISLAFGQHVDWYRNLSAAGGGRIRWRGQAYPVAAPRRIDAASALAAFHPIQRALMKVAGVDGFVHVDDLQPSES